MYTLQSATKNATKNGDAGVLNFPPKTTCTSKNAYFKYIWYYQSYMLQKKCKTKMKEI